MVHYLALPRHFQAEITAASDWSLYNDVIQALRKFGVKGKTPISRSGEKRPSFKAFTSLLVTELVQRTVSNLLYAEVASVVPQSEFSWLAYAMSLQQLRRSALPVLTALIGSGGFIIGVWSFISPVTAAQAFGGYMIRVLETTAPSSKTNKASSNSTDNATNLAYVYPHGIRNLGQGLSILALTAYWQFSPRCQNSPLARLTAQRCLGMVITVGALTPIVDAWVNYQIAPDGAEGDLDRKAARVHVMRTGIWLAGGVWCLLG